jgi:hypothetical protein
MTGNGETIHAKMLTIGCFETNLDVRWHKHLLPQLLCMSGPTKRMKDVNRAKTTTSKATGDSSDQHAHVEQASVPDDDGPIKPMDPYSDRHP